VAAKIGVHMALGGTRADVLGNILRLEPLPVAQVSGAGGFFAAEISRIAHRRRLRLR
jgi:hypothetical protein